MSCRWSSNWQLVVYATILFKQSPSSAQNALPSVLSNIPCSELVWESGQTSVFYSSLSSHSWSTRQSLVDSTFWAFDSIFWYLSNVQSSGADAWFAGMFGRESEKYGRKNAYALPCPQHPSSRFSVAPALKTFLLWSSEGRHPSDQVWSSGSGTLPWSLPISPRGKG